MRKFIFIFSVLVSAFVFFACNGKNDDANTHTTAGAGSKGYELNWSTVGLKGKVKIYEITKYYNAQWDNLIP